MERYHHRIQAKAYHLWELSGKPHGRDLDFWLKAERAVITELLEEAIAEEDLLPDLREISEEILMSDFFPRIVIPKKMNKSNIGWVKVPRMYQIRKSGVKYDYNTCPRCESNDSLLTHPNAINSRACSRCLIEWDEEGNIRNLEDGEVFETESEL